MELTTEEQLFANIGAYLGFNKSYEALLEEARQSQVVITEQETKALIRTGKRQIELRLSDLQLQFLESNEFDYAYQAWLEEGGPNEIDE